MCTGPHRLVSRLLVLLLLAAATSAAAQTSFVAFESGPVRPLALSPDGSQLFAANTPDGRLEVFDISTEGLVHAGSVPVGLEPVAVAARTDDEVWVVNHLSDSVSVVDIPSRRVVRTLLVGDEPRDIVVTDPDGDGPLGERVFVTTAHRGQHRTDPSLAAVPGAGDPQLTTPGVGRADVWVFDADSPGASFGGVPLGIVALFGDTPRALAVSPDGGTVYAAIFHSGNQTAVVNEGTVCNGFAGAGSCSGDGVTSPNGLPGGNLPGGNPGPSTNHESENAPEVGLVVQYDGASGEWQDELGRNWSNGIRFDLPDLDVFEIDAAALTSSSHAQVGTILFNMAVNPVTGNLYVSNTEAVNLTRFEGPGVFGGTTVQGNLAQSRISVITQPAGTVLPRHLNKHIDYGQRPAPAGTRDHSLATPTDMAVSSDGTRLYVAAFGSSKVGVFDTAALEADTFDPTTASASYLDVSGGGPGGLALDEANGRLYVLTRFDDSISVLDLASGAELNHIPLHNPEPLAVTAGRPFLYDAFGTSSNGEASCSSCHIFGDMDSLAWDLGNPDDDVAFNPQPINLEAGASGAPSPINGTGNARDFHPMKGPMTTQTLRGMVNSGHMHWRGDRAQGFFGVDDPHTNDSELSFKNFIVAFPGLVGGDTPATDPGLQADVQAFADFALELTLPPNPVRALDNGLTVSEQAGHEFFLGLGSSSISDGVPLPELGFSCEGCHTLDPAQGFFGTGGNASFEAETQIVKIPHIRNAYQKIGMFGLPDVSFVGNADGNAHQGDQVRGTGFLHDGSLDTMFHFFRATVFDPEPDKGFLGGDPERRDVEAFMLAFDSDLAPITGQQVTLDSASGPDVDTRIDLLEARAGAAFVSKVLGGATTECDLVAKGTLAGESRGWLYDPATDSFAGDRAGDTPLESAALRALASQAGQEITFTCLPPGSGARVALDRDEDGALDGDERDAGTDPADAASVVGACDDGLDNDGDGAVDLDDDGCQSAEGTHERPECSDGWDNDNDGAADGADSICNGRPWHDDEALLVGCGDGIVDPGEECDDGNTADGDDCDSTCMLPSCGNGIVDPLEECDDGNTVDSDACSNMCVADCSTPAWELKSLKVSLKFNKPGKDKITAKAKEWTLPADITPSSVTVNVGGAEVTGTLDTKGKWKSADKRDKIQLKQSKKSGLWKLEVNRKKNDFAADLEDEGLTNTDNPKPGVTVMVPLEVTIDGTCYEAEPSLTYKSKAGKKGNAK